MAALFLAALFLGNFHSGAFALEEVTGLNLTADEGLGVRRTGFALNHAAFQEGADGALNAPAAMNDADDFSFSTSHAERFGVAHFDYAALLVPWHASSTLGLGVARYAVNGIPRYSEVAPGTQPSGEPEGTFSTSDWLVSGAFARRYGALDVGGTLHMLYRQLDQSGLGMRADAMAQYTFKGDDEFRVGAFLRGLVPSLARWESGRSEYEAPEALLFAAGRWAVPYFYGRLQAGWESPGLFQTGGKSANDLQGERSATDVAGLFAASHVGAEFQFDFGLSLRAGLEGLDAGAGASALRLGAGYSWRRIVGIDYAFSSHPQLEDSHRLALQFTPSFPRFEGRHFRPKAGAGGMHAPTPEPSPENTPRQPEEIDSGKPAPDGAPQAPATEILE